MIVGRKIVHPMGVVEEEECVERTMFVTSTNAGNAMQYTMEKLIATYTAEEENTKNCTKMDQRKVL